MVELAVTNRDTGRSLYWRFGVGSRQGLAAALVDMADIIAETLRQRAAP